MLAEPVPDLSGITIDTVCARGLSIAWPSRRCGLSYSKCYRFLGTGGGATSLSESERQKLADTLRYYGLLPSGATGAPQV